MEANFSLPAPPARVELSGRSILVLVVATLLVLLAAHLSPTEHVTGPTTQNVAYLYGEVTSAGRVPALYHRFEVEAVKLCEQLERAGLLAPPASSDCVTRVVDDAVRRIGAPLLTAYHEAQQAPAPAIRVARAG